MQPESTKQTSEENKLAEHKLNPKEGEVWYHPLTLNEYSIHSVTDDGWVRYRSIDPRTNRSVDISPLWTQPTLNFIKKYQRSNNV